MVLYLEFWASLIGGFFILPSSIHKNDISGLKFKVYIIDNLN